MAAPEQALLLPTAGPTNGANAQPHTSKNKLQKSIDRLVRHARTAEELASSALAKVETLEKVVTELRIKQAEAQDLRSLLARYDALLCRTLAIARERKAVVHGR
jgi:outer membrane cobalamin receptor